MGGASSKAARQLPKTAKPTWAGARTPGPSDLRGEPPPPAVSRSVPPEAQKASETRTEAIEKDAQDPDFLAKLSRLGPVKVDHHMRTYRPAANLAQHVFEARRQSEIDAASAQPTHNHLVAASLNDLLEELQYTTSREDVAKLAKRYDIDVQKLERVARFVNTPTVDPDSVVREVADDGTETVTMRVMWKNPPVPR